MDPARREAILGGWVSRGGRETPEGDKGVRRRYEEEDWVGEREGTGGRKTKRGKRGGRRGKGGRGGQRGGGMGGGNGGMGGAGAQVVG